MVYLIDLYQSDKTSGPVTATSGPGVETLDYAFELLSFMRSKNEVRGFLEDGRADIEASLVRIERLKAANRPKAVLAERLRLAEIRRQGRLLLLELKEIEVSTTQSNQDTEENR